MRVWDREAEGGGGWVEMLALNAKEACARDPKRYSFEEPGPAPKEVEHKEPDAPENSIEIPSEWPDLPWQPRRKLAMAFGAEKSVTSDEAATVIKAELKRRADNKAAVQPVEPMPIPGPKPGED